MVYALNAESPNPYAHLPVLVCGPQLGPDGRPVVGPGGQPLGPVGTWVNRAKLAQKVFWCRAKDYPCTVGANVRNSAAMSPPADQGQQGDMELSYLMARSTGAFAAMLTASHLGRQLMNKPVESTLVFGTAELPAELAQGLLIPAATPLQFDFDDLSGNSNDIKVVGCGQQIVDPLGSLGATPEEIRLAHFSRNTHPYWLTTDAGAQVTATANATSRHLMTVPGGAHFNAVGLVARVSDVANVDDLTVEIYEGGRRVLMDGPIELQQIASVTRSVTGFAGGLVHAASLPFRFPISHVFRPGTVIEVRITNADAAQTVSIAFVGQLLYYKESPIQYAVPQHPSTRFARQVPQQFPSLISPVAPPAVVGR